MKEKRMEMKADGQIEGMDKRKESMTMAGISLIRSVLVGPELI